METKGRRNRIKYFLLDTTRDLFNLGRGRSKHADMQESYEKYETRETKAIYSYSTYNRYETVVCKFADFLRDEMGVKYERDFRRLSEDELYYCIDQYFQKQVEEGLAQNTLEIHISCLHKILGEIKPEIREYFTPEARERWRDGIPQGDNDRYNDSQKIIENLYRINEESGVIAELQKLTGSRVGDVKKIQIDEEHQRVFIEGSKGGRDRFIYYDRDEFKEQFERVKELKEKLDKILEEKSYSDIREQYYDDLRRATRKAEEPYHGSHPFRYEFAQSRYEVIKEWDKQEQLEYYKRILEDRGKSEKDIKEAMKSVIERDVIAEAVISEELGHSRIDISLHYLKLRRK